MAYDYTGNQLATLTETVGTTTFTYDINGNMIKDSRKNLDYRYNSLNLLSGVDSAGISKAKYTYAADGTKLAVSGGGLGYDYRGSLIYKRNGNALTLESAAFSDGRIIKSTGGYEVNYFITDHLGSIRTIFDASGSVKEQNDYYPFGGRYAADTNYQVATSNRFKYNGKELQTTSDVGFLDYGARMYDSKIGRWFGQDPAEQFSSPYNFCGNNPTVFVDPNGESSTYYQDEFGNLLLNTNDGSSALITVPNSKKDDFIKQAFWAIKSGMSDSKGWNYYWKEELTGGKWNDQIERNYSKMSEIYLKLKNIDIDKFIKSTGIISDLASLININGKYENVKNIGNISGYVNGIILITNRASSEAKVKMIEDIFDGTLSITGTFGLQGYLISSFGRIMKPAQIHTNKYLLYPNMELAKKSNWVMNESAIAPFK